MRIQLKFFASLRETLNVSTETLDVTQESLTVAQLKELLILRGEPWSDALAKGRAVRVAVNHQMVEDEVLVIDGAEVALFPPVTGG